jgi:apolipoprotein N-acyltransferase
MKKHIQFLLLSLLSGLLFMFSWPEIGFVPLIFVAFVPLFVIEENLRLSGAKRSAWNVFGYSYLSFLIWNVGATWWIWYASDTGAVLAFLANSLLMSFFFTLAHRLRKQFKTAKAILLLPICWLGFEYIHHTWDISWPWLTLGNAFSGMHQAVQWYEFTGTSGGSLWVLIINLLFFKGFKQFLLKEEFSSIKGTVQKIVFVFLIPILLSLFMYFNQHDKGAKVRVVVVQPNIDPYNEKFDYASVRTQITHFLDLATSVIDDSTQLVIGPETALPRSIEEDYLHVSEEVVMLREWMSKHPGVSILTGASTHRFYPNADEKPTVTARKVKVGGEMAYLDAYNTGVLITNTKIVSYHKSKLVPGVEQMPFPAFFGFFESFAIDLGGTTGTLGKQEERTVFEDDKGIIRAAPSICYESVYGDFMRDFVVNGSNMIAIITNDGWWKDTPGYRQHAGYARLRAIETRRSIARSANTGISCFINQRGDILEKLPWWTPGAIKADIQLNESRTLYSITGDLIGRFCMWLLALIVLFSVFKRFTRKKALA